MCERDIDSERLIRLVRDTPIIWDRSLDAYKNRQKTNDAWKKICKEIRPDYQLLDDIEQKHFAQLAKKKWNNIRDHWQKNCRRLENTSRDGGGGHKPRKYMFHKMLRFLEDGHSVQSFASPADCSTEPYDNETMSFEELSQEFVEPALVYADSHCEESASVYPAAYKRRKTDDGPFAPNEDRHFMFLQSILPSLRTFTEEQTIDFQLGVLQLIRTIRNPFWVSPDPSESSHIATSRSGSHAHPQNLRTPVNHQDEHTTIPKEQLPQKMTSSFKRKQEYSTPKAESVLTDDSNNSQLSESNF